MATTGLYGTGEEIWADALEDVGHAASSGWPSENRKLRAINYGMQVIQELTGHYEKRDAQTFVDSGNDYASLDHYWEITGVTPSCFEFRGVAMDHDEDGYYEDTERVKIVTLPELMMYREQAFSVTSGYYIFALRENVGGVSSTVRIEAHPGASSDGYNVEFRYGMAPVVTTLTATCYQPRNLLEAFIRAEVARARNPEKWAIYDSLFRDDCARYVRGMATTGRDGPALMAGFLAQQSYDLD